MEQRKQSTLNHEKKTLLAIILESGFSFALLQNKNYSQLDHSSFIKSYKSQKGNSLLIDVRTPTEFKNGTIQNAKNINFYEDNFEQEISKLDTTKTAFIFCKSGGRSKKASSLFFKVGFPKVVDLESGYSKYKN